jgi:hypothetical protein
MHDPYGRDDTHCESQGEGVKLGRRRIAPQREQRIRERRGEGQGLLEIGRTLASAPARCSVCLPSSNGWMKLLAPDKLKNIWRAGPSPMIGTARLQTA